MKSAYLICVGKLKDKNLEAIEKDFLKRISNPKLEILELKANAENKDAEADSIIKKIESLNLNPYVVTLTEFGTEYDSPRFSKFISQKIDSSKNLIFVICGAMGPGDELLDKTHLKLSLSKLTFPHKLARIIFVEQFYRAMTIRTGHPYHN